MRTIDTQVMIVGTGPAGASAALFLRSLGVDVYAISRMPWVTDTPRAHILNLRTMEILRDAGVDDACRQRGVPEALMANIVWAESLNGRELARCHAWGNGPWRAHDDERASAASMLSLEQEDLEPILIGEAARRGATIRFAQELKSFEQDADGVTAQVTDLVRGDDYRVRARYLYGADGARSLVAQTLGLPMLGEAGIGTALNVCFEADLRQHVARRPGTLYNIFQPALAPFGGAAVLRMVRPFDRWVAIFPQIASGVQNVQMDESVAQSLIQGMIGEDTTPTRILGISRWLINRVIAAHYSIGRVFCGGDAVHRHPPMNGLGANTSIQDSYNLAWKLAQVLHGTAGESLLETYSIERQPIGRTAVDRAVKSFEESKALGAVLGVRPGHSAEQMQAGVSALRAPSEQGREQRRGWFKAVRQKHYTYLALGVEMNQVYVSAAVVADGNPSPQFDTDPELHAQDSTHPGFRLPHCWLERDGRLISIHDLAGHGRFAVFTGLGGQPWIDAAREVGAAFGIDIASSLIGIGQTLIDPYAEWQQLREIEDEGCILVRPDMHVGFRTRTLATDCRATLELALATLLCRAIPGR